MHPTSQNQIHAAEQVDIFPDQNTTHQYQQCPCKMGQYMWNLVSWEMSWHQTLKHNWGGYFKTSIKRHTCELPYHKWSTHNHQHQWQQTSHRKYHHKWNVKTKKIHSNRHEILLGTQQNMTKPFSRILGRGKEKPGGLCHKTPHNMAPQNYETNIFETNNNRHRKFKIPANWNQKRVCCNYQYRGNPENK